MIIPRHLSEILEIIFPEKFAFFYSWFWVIGVGFLSLTLVGGAAALIGAALFGSSNEDEVDLQIKQQVSDSGCQYIYQSVENIFDKIADKINNIFESAFKPNELIINQIISNLDNHLEQQRKNYQSLLEQQEVDQKYLHQKHQELTQIKNQLLLFS